ncbi:aspartyl protease family protein [Emticicia sp. SJ17W-69]|uniref:aspartyl protease family protein n=1 Tax=Emticicia sp. SJ17W-69 TaxID=3421657 RepID=UPI003EBE752B
MTYSFERMADGGLIIVSITLDKKSKLRMVLDTGCSNTTIDSNALYLAGYELKDAIELVEIETANGIVESEVFEVHQIKSMGITKNRFQIQVYDFLSHGIFSNYDGLLGLDFLEGTKFCIDTDLNEITISNK